MRMIQPDELPAESVAEFAGCAPVRDQAASPVRGPIRAPARAKLITPVSSTAPSAAAKGTGWQMSLPRELGNPLAPLAEDRPHDLPAAAPVGGLAKRMVDILLVIL